MQARVTASQPALLSAPDTRGRVSKFVIPDVIFGIGALAEVGGADERAVEMRRDRRAA